MPYIDELLLEFKQKSGLKLTEKQSDLFIEKLVNYGLATVHDEEIFNEALKMAEYLERKNNKEAVFMFQDMVTEIEDFINDHDPKSEDLLKIRDIMDKHLGH